VLLGLAYEVVEPPTQALVSDLVPEDARAFAYSALNASLAVAGVLAGLVAAAVSGAGLRWLFVVDAATCLACAALVARSIPRSIPRATVPVENRPDGQDSRRVGTPPRPSPRPRHRVSPVARARWAAALRDRRLRPVVAFGTVAATVTMVVVLGVPLLVEQRGLPPAVTGWVLAAGAAASVPGAWLAAALRRRTDDAGILLVGEVVASAGLATIALATHPATLAVGLVAFDVGGLLVIATTMARAGTLAPEGSRGTYLAVLGLTWGLATSVAPVVLTMLGTAYGPGAPFGAAAVALLATTLVRAGQRPRLRRRTSLGGLPPAYDREGSTT
jgi:predicted MFS family arabinose efflux permease